MVLTTLYKHQWCSLPKQTLLRLLLLLCLFCSIMHNHSSATSTHSDSNKLVYSHPKQPRAVYNTILNPKQSIMVDSNQRTNQPTNINDVDKQTLLLLVLLLFWFSMPIRSSTSMRTISKQINNLNCLHRIKLASFHWINTQQFDDKQTLVVFVVVVVLVLNVRAYPLITYVDTHSDQTYNILIETNKHRFIETWLKQTNIRIDGLRRNKLASFHWTNNHQCCWQTNLGCCCCCFDTSRCVHDLHQYTNSDQNKQSLCTSKQTHSIDHMFTRIPNQSLGSK